MQSAGGRIWRKFFAVRSPTMVLSAITALSDAEGRQWQICVIDAQVAG
jgi:hypothetical protein